MTDPALPSCVKNISPAGAAVRKLLHRPAAVFAFAVIALFGAAAIASEIHGAIAESAGTEPLYQIEEPSLEPGIITGQHWLGVDYLGRDIFWRAIAGTATAFKVGIIGAGIAVLIGTFLGLLAGYAGGIVDAVVVWLYSVFAAMPTLLFVLAFALLADKGFLPESIMSGVESIASLLRTDAATLSVYTAIGLTGWSSMCIVIRAEVMKISGRPFVAASKVAGVGTLKILFRHILPNISYLVITFFTLRFAYAVMTEVIVSFLGVGGRSVPSWGMMIANGQERLWRGDFLEVGTATFCVFMLVLAFQLAGDQLRDILDPRNNR